MKHLTYKYVSDYLVNSGLFDNMPDINELSYSLIISDLISRLPLQIYADILSHMHCDLCGQQIEEGLSSPSLSDLFNSIESSFDVLWDKIKDHPTDARETLLIDCWYIDYNYDDSHFAIRVCFHLPACAFCCNSDGSYFS